MPISIAVRPLSSALSTLLCAIAFTAPLSALAQAPRLPAETEEAIAVMVTKALAETSVPSVSIAIVKDRELAYAKAFGVARLHPRTAATPEFRYKIASNSKQFAAAAILLLVEEGKLSLDDRVSRFFPKLTRASDISVRQLLSHTSGYQDYYAVDYLSPSMQADMPPNGILALYAQKPLDFEPGTRYQYSNTNYVLLGRIIEQVSGEPLARFLRSRIFDKLGMDSAIDVDVRPLGPTYAAGYTRYALGPVREVGAEGKGWMWATGGLAMTASDLAKWDISLMEGSILTPASLTALSTATLLKDGTTSNYALGLGVSQMDNGHRRWGHTGGASGFLSTNATYPDDGMSITVLSNGEGDAFKTIAAEIEKLLFASTADPAAASSLARAPAVRRPAERPARPDHDYRRPERFLQRPGARRFRQLAGAAGRRGQHQPGQQERSRRHGLSQVRNYHREQEEAQHRGVRETRWPFRPVPGPRNSGLSHVEQATAA